MATLSDMLVFLRKRNNLSQAELSEKIGLTRSAIGMYETGRREPDLETLELFADFYNVDMNTLTGRPTSPALPNLPDIIPIHDVQRVPVVGLSAAGAPVYAEQDIEGYIWTDRNHGGVYFGVRIRGTSMNAAGIDNGDIVLIRKQDTVEDGEIALVLIDDGATVKRFHQEGDTVILSPQSTDPANQVQIYNLKDHTIRILGKVVETRKNF